MCANPSIGGVQFAREGREENAVDEGRFAGAGNPRDRRHHAQRNFYIHITQIVFPGAEDLHRAAGGPPLEGNFDGSSPGQIVAGE